MRIFAWIGRVCCAIFLLVLGACSAPQQDVIAEVPPATPKVKTETPPPAAQPQAQMQSLISPPPAEVKAAPPQYAPASGATMKQGRADMSADSAYYVQKRLYHHHEVQPLYTLPQGNNRFPDAQHSSVLSVAEHPVSTFSIDVDTASYAYVRRVLTTGGLPPTDAVRVEEMVNYFPYDYPAPENKSAPFRVSTTLMPNPWRADAQLLHIGIRGYDIARTERPRANVVLLIDTSGSMSSEDRLPLLRQSFRMLIDQLRDDDRLSIVTYAGSSTIPLEPTSGRDRQRMLQALENLHSGGSTAGAEGLRRAYELAERNFDREAVNRVILATDGDFNVGITDPKELERFIVQKRKTGIYLSIFGVGEGNLNDALMQKLAQAGNGNAAYIDSLLEARKALDEQLGSTLFPIADDVKIQVEFNPKHVEAYRLVGYETRALKREDFNDDKIDAGDIGAGHTVTALYEILPKAGASRVDPLRYQKDQRASTGMGGDELAFVKLRYKRPGESSSHLIEQAVNAADALKSVDIAPQEQRFAVAVAAFAQRLRRDGAADGMSYSDIVKLANGARGGDSEGYRAEFVRLVRMAETKTAAAVSGETRIR